MTRYSKNDFIYIYIYFTRVYFPVLDKSSSQVPPLVPPGSRLQFLWRIGFSNQSHCSLIYHRVLITHALALSASQFVHKKKSLRIYTSMYSAGLELMELTNNTRQDDRQPDTPPGRPAPLAKYQAVCVFGCFTPS